MTKWLDYVRICVIMPVRPGSRAEGGCFSRFTGIAIVHCGLLNLAGHHLFCFKKSLFEMPKTALSHRVERSMRHVRVKLLNHGG
jgi:hypothetical protein